MEVFEVEGDIDRASDGEEVEDAIGGAAEGHHGDDGVFESGAGHNVFGAEVLFEEMFDGFAGGFAFIGFGGVFGGDAGREGERHADGFHSDSHGVGGEHAAAGAGSGTGIAVDGFTFFVGNLSRDVLSVGFVGGADVKWFAVEAAGFDGAAVDEERGSVESASGDEAAGHIFVAAGEHDESIVVESRGLRFEGVGDDVA